MMEADDPSGITPISIAEAIKGLRLREGLTQSQLGHQQVVSKLERGFTHGLPPLTIRGIVSKLGFESMEDLVAEWLVIKRAEKVAALSANENAQEIGRAIQVVRKDLKHTYSDFAYSYSTISKIENGRWYGISPQAVRSMIARLGFASDEDLMKRAQKIYALTPNRKLALLPTNDIGVAVRIIRRAHGLRQAEIGHSVTVSNIERGIITYSKEALANVIRALGFESETELLDEANKIQPSNI